jgi:hypothetical protein
MGNRSTPIDQHADLPTNLTREFGELSREVVVEEDVGVETAAKEAL